ncbi:MAG: hypothetical protein ABIF06_02170 [bacterium]
MPKNIDDIIIPEKKRSIRDIPIPEGRRKNNGNGTSFVPKDYYSSRSPIDRIGFFRENNKFTIPPGRGRKGIWIATGLALIVLVFALLSIFNGATLTYIPRSTALSFSNDIYTSRKTGEEILLYSTVKISKDLSKDVVASGEEEVSRKASGTIIVYNDASTEPQRLIENTRFETPEGLIYRIPNAIVIPGKKTVSGVTQPGSVETIVYADDAGEKYNVGLKDFTVPGLSGTSRFSTIYARSKTKMSGGFVGMEKVVSNQDKVRAQTELETALREELVSEAKVQVPEDFILPLSLSSMTFESLPQTNSTSGNNVTINMRGNLYGVMFKRSDLSNYLALKKITLINGESVNIIPLDSLELTFAGSVPTDLLNSEEIKFSVTGDALAVWRTDEVALKADLIGKNKKDVVYILNNYPTVFSATATIRPFWKKTFPDDSTDISIKKLPVK